MTKFQSSILEFISLHDDDQDTLMDAFWVHSAEKFGENKTYFLWKEYYLEEIDFPQWKRTYGRNT